jgi:hypothetical protein
MYLQKEGKAQPRSFDKPRARITAHELGLPGGVSLGVSQQVSAGDEQVAGSARWIEDD